jgi:hypothetical protein
VGAIRELTEREITILRRTTEKVVAKPVHKPAAKGRGGRAGEKKAPRAARATPAGAARKGPRRARAQGR